MVFTLTRLPYESLIELILKVGIYTSFFFFSKNDHLFCFPCLGLIIVTDAISFLGLGEGMHRLGQFDIEIKNGQAMIAGTNTLCGSIATMNQCVKFFKKATCELQLFLGKNPFLVRRKCHV